MQQEAEELTSFDFVTGSGRTGRSLLSISLLSISLLSISLLSMSLLSMSLLSIRIELKEALPDATSRFREARYEEKFSAHSRLDRGCRFFPDRPGGARQP
jgi:hypothetical protein